MTTDDILLLVKAGFTKEDITGFTTAKPAEVKPEEVTITQPEEKPAEVEAKPAEKPAESEALTKVLAKIDQTLAAMQNFALKTDGQPARKPNDAISILGSVINKE